MILIRRIKYETRYDKGTKWIRKGKKYVVAWSEKFFDGRLVICKLKLKNSEPNLTEIKVNRYLR